MKNVSKKRVCLLFGGKSGEHEVSLQSAKSIYEALDKDKYDVVLVGIDKDGKWLLGDSSSYLLNATDPKLIALNKTNSSEVTPMSQGDHAALVSLSNASAPTNIDVFFPITHGTYGEDGSLQGMLELMDAAYVGAGVLGSAVGMDKDMMKRLLISAGLPVVQFVALKQHQIDKYTPDKLIEELGLPLFVKPANMGSSVGVSKAHDKGELEKAIQDAFEYDTKILVEEYMPCREVECSVLGNEHPKASVLGEVIPQHEFYSYDAKYIDENGAQLRIPADLPPDTTKKIQDLAIRAFITLECSGMARVDFFVTETGNVYINEINTLPGFTNISMYPKLWEASGLSYARLLEKLIELAEERHSEKAKLKRDYT